MNNSQFPLARTNGLVVQETPDELLVYDLDSDKAHCLNETAARVWKACDGKNSVADIAALIGSDAGDDVVWLAIDQLNENNLLDAEMGSRFAGMSRRDVIKKVGLGTMIALPIIASLAAPRSAMAASSCRCPSGPGPQGDFECSTQTGCPSQICNVDTFCA